MSISRQKIIETSVKLFNEKSYSATSVQDIVNTLGVTKAALYYYVSSKEDILFEIFDQTMATAEKRLNNLMKEEMTVEERIRKIVFNHITAVFDEAPNISIFFTEKAHLTADNLKAINARRRKYEEIIAEVFKQGVEEGVLKKDIDILSTVYALLGMCNWLYHWYNPHGRLKPDDLAKRYSDIILFGIMNEQ